MGRAAGEPRHSEDRGRNRAMDFAGRVFAGLGVLSPEPREPGSTHCARCNGGQTSPCRAHP